MSKELIEKLRKGLNNKHLSDAQKKSIKAKIESLEKLEKKSEKAKPAKKVVEPKKEVKAKPAKKEKVSTVVKKEFKRHTAGRSKDDIHRDKSRTALKGGKRISAEGNVYYEYRPNRSDVNPRKKFEDGGNVDSDTKYIVVDEKILAATIPNRFNNTKGTDEAEVIAIAPSEIGFTKLGDVFFLKNKKVRPATSSDFEKYKVAEPKSSKKEDSYRISIGYDHKNNYELYQVVGIDNDYVGEYHKDKKDAEAELKDLEGVKFEDGGNIEPTEFEVAADENVEKMAKGGSINSDVKRKNIVKFLSQFPNNAKGWDLATEEVRDLAREAKEFYNDIDLNVSNEDKKALPALDFRKLNTPSEWNTKGKKYILSTFDKMSDRAKKEFYNYRIHWFGNIHEEDDENVEKMAKGGSIITDASDVQRIKNSIAEGEGILRAGKIHGRKMSKEELDAVQRSVDNSKKKIGLMAKGGSIATCPVGTKIQTIIFSKEFYNKVRAVKWLTKHGYKGTIGDDKSTTVRFRQVSPDKFEDDTFRTIELTKGVKAVIGCPKKKMAKGGEIGGKYNYFYYKQPISKSEFLKNVPENWEKELDEYGEYSYGGYRAGLRD